MHDFDRFWEIYPKRTAKLAARKAWDQLKPGPELVEDILDGVMRAADTEEWVKQQGRYVPYAGTWLRGQRWLDEYGTQARASGREYEPWVCPHTPECKHRPACDYVIARDGH